MAHGCGSWQRICLGMRAVLPRCNADGGLGEAGGGCGGEPATWIQWLFTLRRMVRNGFGVNWVVVREVAQFV